MKSIFSHKKVLGTISLVVLIIVIGSVSSSDLKRVLSITSENNFSDDSKRSDLSVSLSNHDYSLTSTFCTYFGGTGAEYVNRVDDLAMDGATIDAEDNIIVVGRTISNDLPTVNAYQNSPNMGSDAFIAKFAQNGNIIFSTYLGGSRNDWATAVCTDSEGNIYVTGTTASSNFPTLNAYQPSFMGGAYFQTDIFMAKFSANGTLLFSSYFGGSADDWGYKIHLDLQGSFVITGSTYSTDIYYY